MTFFNDIGQNNSVLSDIAELFQYRITFLKVIIRHSDASLRFV